MKDIVLEMAPRKPIEMEMHGLVVEAVSPRVSFEVVDEGIIVTIVDIDGTHSALLPKGIGETGVGISNIIFNDDYTLTIELSDGRSYKTGNIRGLPGKDGTDGVQDVQVNGDSVLQDRVANIPVATPVSLGVVCASGSSGGISITQEGLLKISTPSLNDYKSLSTNVKAPVLGGMKYATFYALAKAAGDSTQSASSNPVGTYTDEAKAAIQQMLDVPSNDDIPDVSVQDVQVNGTSVLQDGVANVPKASTSELGVIQLGTGGTTGLKINNSGYLSIDRAPASIVKGGTAQNMPITPDVQHTSAFYGLAKAAGDTTQSASSNAVGTYTDEAKVAIQKMLGVYREWELIADETVAEDSEIYNVTTDISGQPFELSEMYVRVWLKPSTTGTADYVSAQNLLVTKSDATSSSAAPTKKYLNNGAATFMDYRCEIVGGVAYSTAAATSSPNSTGTVERICSTNDTFKAFRGFRLQKYSTNTSLIPKDTVIKIYGIRA